MGTCCVANEGVRGGAPNSLATESFLADAPYDPPFPPDTVGTFSNHGIEPAGDQCLASLQPPPSILHGSCSVCPSGAPLLPTVQEIQFDTSWVESPSAGDTAYVLSIFSPAAPVEILPVAAGRRSAYAIELVLRVVSPTPAERQWVYRQESKHESQRMETVREG